MHFFCGVFLSLCAGVIALFSLPLFYRRRQVNPFMSLPIDVLPFICIFDHTTFVHVSQEQVDAFLAKIQALIGNVKDL